MGAVLMPELEKPGSPVTFPRPERMHPGKRTSPSLQSPISGNNYDVVLINQPDARDDYPFYDRIVRLAEDKKLKIYSPHDDVRRGQDIEEVLTFATSEAIPRTRGVIAHLTAVTDEIQRMFGATYLNSIPFIIMHSNQITPFTNSDAKIITSHPSYRGGCAYKSEEHAISFLERKIPELIRSRS